LIPVGFGYGDGDEFFLWGWVWDSETRPRPAPLPSLKNPSCVRETKEVEKRSVKQPLNDNYA